MLIFGIINSTNLVETQYLASLPGIVIPNQMKPIIPPDSTEYPPWAAAEIALVQHTDLLSALREALDHSLDTLTGLNEQQLEFRYAEGKWSVREIWQHVIDTERVLSYRALRYSRGDMTVLSGFDAERYTQAIRNAPRPWNDLMEDYRTVRQATILLFNSLSNEMLLQKGQAGKSQMTTRALGFLIAGHDAHHLNVIRNKYLRGN